MSTAPALLDDDSCYRALAAHDARFDGRFFTGVTSTGIYCRPVCRVRTPQRANCRFFAEAAQAEHAGFRPCLRCRPELAPGALPWSLHDASATLAEQAARLLDEPGGWAGGGADDDGPLLPRLAARLGVSDRHLRRIFEARFGVSPLQYRQTRRLLSAKQLLTDTDLPVTDVALASGFASVRRFNTVFADHYGMPPTRLRQGTPAAAEGVATVRLGLRPPYDAQAVMEFMARRAIPGVEQVNDGEYTRTASIPSRQASHTGWFSVRIDAPANQAVLRVGEGLRGALPALIRRVRHVFDLDADPAAINAVLHGDFPEGDGLRVPGTIDGFELAVRAVLGQQITVAAARTLAGRLAERFGAPLATPQAGLVRLFPSAATLASATGEDLGQLGIVRQRQAAITALADAVHRGRLALHPFAPLAETTAALRALPGIGDWTAQYIAMRALRWPDAFPAADVALQSALGVRQQPRPALAAEAASQAWRPWRSYAVLRAWARGTPGASKP